MAQPELIRRKAAVEATFAKYRRRPFDWKARTTCLHLAAFHLRQMGHRPPPLPRIGSLLAAKRALKARGCTDVGELLDSVGLERIAPARMLLGDLAVLRSDDGIGAIVVSVGTKIIGWHEDQAEMAVMDAHEIAGAWRA